MNKNLVCMLIDDDPEDHEIFLLALQNIESLVECVIETDSRSALEKLTKSSIHPDFIFVDMNMPRMNGKEFIVEMRKLPHLQHVQVVAYSSSSFDKDHIMKLGASKFITKPSDIPRLEKVLDSCFRTEAA